MNFKALLGTKAYWTINKELAKKIGLYETLLLQHFIDLDENFFKGMESGFYQQQKRLEKDLPLSINQIRSATKKLSELGLLSATRQGVPPKYHYIIHYDNLAKLTGLTFKGAVSKHLETTQERQRIKEPSLNTNNKDILDDVYGKIFFKIVELYPKNRIGNRQHGLKKFKNLDIDQAKLALKNLKRYLAVVEPMYVKMLQNYITEECWSEAWLNQEEETKRNKTSKTDINHNFSGDYGIIN